MPPGFGRHFFMPAPRRHSSSRLPCQRQERGLCDTHTLAEPHQAQVFGFDLIGREWRVLMRHDGPPGDSVESARAASWRNAAPLASHAKRQGVRGGFVAKRIPGPGICQKSVPSPARTGRGKPRSFAGAWSNRVETDTSGTSGCRSAATPGRISALSARGHRSDPFDEERTRAVR